MFSTLDSLRDALIELRSAHLANRNGREDTRFYGAAVEVARLIEFGSADLEEFIGVDPDELEEARQEVLSAEQDLREAESNHNDEIAEWERDYKALEKKLKALQAAAGTG